MFSYLLKVMPILQMFSSITCATLEKRKLLLTSIQKLVPALPTFCCYQIFPFHYCFWVGYFRNLLADIQRSLRETLLSPQQLVFVCPPSALFKAEDLQKEHSSGPKYLWARPSTGTGSEARITSRERDTYCVSVLRKGCDNLNEYMCMF